MDRPKHELSRAADAAVAQLIEKHGAIFLEGDAGMLAALLSCAFFDGAKWMADSVSRQIKEGDSQ